MVLTSLVAILLTLILGPQAFAQQLNNTAVNITDFSRYGNSLINVNIDYPDDWVYTESVNYFSSDDQTVVFIPAEIVNATNLVTSANNSETYAVAFQVGKQQDLPFKNMQLDLYAKYIEELQRSMGNNVTKIEPTKFNTINGYRLYLDFQNGNKGFVVLFNKVPESYYMLYASQKDLYERYKPIAERMIQTFAFSN